MELIDKYKNLPLDIIKNIIKFNETIKWRNGVFIDQIDKNDPRYSLLKTIPRPFRYLNSYFNFHYIIFFPRQIYSTVKRFLHVYSSYIGEVVYLLDVEDLFTVKLFMYTNPYETYDVVQIKRQTF